MSNLVPLSSSSPRARLGRYRLIAQLGQGGMGTIHLAVAEGIGGFRKLFVVKELKRELSENEQFLQLFMREARLAARLNHPNVVHTVEADHEDGRYFLAMEFLDGQPFNELLRRAEQALLVPLALRLQVICHALAGLHHAHELRDYDGRALHVVHRDVSPANIFITYDGQVKVLDFGIAKAADVENTQPGSFKGKIGYAAPEQLRLQPADRRTDVFAAGVVMWETIALRHLVRGKPSRQIFEARLLGTEPRIAQLVPDVDPRLAAICDRAMCCDPEQRYPSAEALCVDLQDYLSERKLGVDPMTLGAFMRSKFAEERGVMHQLIDAQLRVEPDTETFAMKRRFPPLSDGQSEVSRVDQRSAVGAQPAPSLLPDMLRGKSATRLLGAFALTALVAAAVFRLAASGERERPAELGPSVAPAPAAAEPARAEPAAAPVAPSSEPPRAEPSVRAAAAPAHHEAVPAAPEPSVREEQPAQDDEQLPAAEPATPAEPARVGAAAVRRREGPAGLIAPASARSGSREAGVERGAGARDAAAPALDIDLRSIPRPAQRPLDLNNPFR